MHLREIMDRQQEFDTKHKGKFEWSEKIGPENLQMLQFLILSVLGELGELANIVKKIERGDFTFSEKESDISEEIVDIFIYTIKMCNQLGIDLEDGFLKKLQKNWERFKGFEKES